jgi:hypothetical protein
MADEVSASGRRRNAIARLGVSLELSADTTVAAKQHANIL